LGEPLAHEIHDDGAHDAGGVGEEVRPVLRVELTQSHEPQIALVNERGGVEHRDRVRAQDAFVREVTQFRVGEGEHPIDRTSFALSHRLQQLGELPHASILKRARGAGKNFPGRMSFLGLRLRVPSAGSSSGHKGATHEQMD